MQIGSMFKEPVFYAMIHLCESPLTTLPICTCLVFEDWVTIGNIGQWYH